MKKFITMLAVILASITTAAAQDDFFYMGIGVGSDSGFAWEMFGGGNHIEIGIGNSWPNHHDHIGQYGSTCINNDVLMDFELGTPILHTNQCLIVIGGILGCAMSDEDYSYCRAGVHGGFNPDNCGYRGCSLSYGLNKGLYVRFQLSFGYISVGYRSYPYQRYDYTTNDTISGIHNGVRILIGI